MGGGGLGRGPSTDSTWINSITSMWFLGMQLSVEVRVIYLISSICSSCTVFIELSEVIGLKISSIWSSGIVFVVFSWVIGFVISSIYSSGIVFVVLSEVICFSSIF